MWRSDGSFRVSQFFHRVGPGHQAQVSGVAASAFLFSHLTSPSPRLLVILLPQLPGCQDAGDEDGVPQVRDRPPEVSCSSEWWVALAQLSSSAPCRCTCHWSLSSVESCWPLLQSCLSTCGGWSVPWQPRSASPFRTSSPKRCVLPLCRLPTGARADGRADPPVPSVCLSLCSFFCFESRP